MTRICFVSLAWPRGHPFSGWPRSVLAVLALVVSLCMDGCAISFAYRHADWLMLHKLDQYFDLSPEQRKDLNDRIQVILSNHRREALPQYETFLIEVRRRVERGVTAEDMEWFYTSFDRLRDDLFERLVTDGGTFLASVDEHQATTLEQAIQKDNIKAARLATASPQERLKRRTDSTIDVVKDWTGSLTREQRAQIVEWSRSIPDSQPIFFKYRQQRQQQLVALLHQPRTSETAARELRNALVHQDRTAPFWYRQALAEWREAVKALVPRIDRMLTASQRRYALDKLQGVINQVHDLRNG